MHFAVFKNFYEPAAWRARRQCDRAFVTKCCFRIKSECISWRVFALSRVFYDSLLLYHFLCHIFLWSSQEKRAVPNFFYNTCARVCVGAHVQQKRCTNTAYLCKKLAAKSTKKFFRRRFCTIILQLECILLAESAYRKLNESIKKSKEMSKRSKLVTRS